MKRPRTESRETGEKSMKQNHANGKESLRDGGEKLRGERGVSSKCLAAAGERYWKI